MTLTLGLLTDPVAHLSLEGSSDLAAERAQTGAHRTEPLGQPASSGRQRGRARRDRPEDGAPRGATRRRTCRDDPRPAWRCTRRAPDRRPHRPAGDTSARPGRCSKLELYDPRVWAGRGFLACFPSGAEPCRALGSSEHRAPRLLDGQGGGRAQGRKAAPRGCSDRLPGSRGAGDRRAVRGRGVFDLPDTRVCPILSQDDKMD